MNCLPFGKPPRPAGGDPPPRVEALELRRRVSGSLRGWVNVRLAHRGYTFLDCTIHTSHGRKWVGMPGKVQIDLSGNVIRDPKGKVAYRPLVRFDTKELRDRFSDLAVEAVLKVDPHAFEPEGEP